MEVVTTRGVLTEALNFTSGMGELQRRFAARMVWELMDTPGVEIVPQPGIRFKTAVERYASRSDHKWSLTDCESFLVMEERGIAEALAYDLDFQQVGFVALLSEDRR